MHSNSATFLPNNFKGVFEVFAIFELEVAYTNNRYNYMYTAVV